MATLSLRGVTKSFLRRTVSRKVGRARQSFAVLGPLDLQVADGEFVGSHRPRPGSFFSPPSDKFVIPSAPPVIR